MIIRLPGLIDPHVHVREPGATHKEDWESCTAAALAGGVTTILAMPNTRPPVTEEASLRLALAGAEKAYCDYAQYLGAGPENAVEAARLARHAAGLKLYLDQTYGPLKLDDMTLWAPHFQLWPKDAPLAIHAEGRTLAAALAFAGLYRRPIHLCHVAHREEILLIRQAKACGWPVSCEVTPHHLFLTEADLPRIGPGRAEVRPRLATPADQQALWDNLDIIDCFATDHAPHTLAEKDGDNPPPGFPGLETALPLLLTAVRAGRLSLEDIVQRCYTNPARIFNLSAPADTWIDVDPAAEWEIRGRDLFSRCAWTPFEGHRVCGKVLGVTLRGQRVYENGQLLLNPGSGQNLRPRLSSI
jgi:carbamoyl-phosphate synthase/aspartate carbamoyltransferase/dihydroorotase